MASAFRWLRAHPGVTATAIISIVLLQVAIGIAQMRRDAAPPAEVAQSGQPSGDNPLVTPPQQVRLSGLVAEYEQNEVAAQQRWGGRLVEIADATVQQISLDAFNQPYLVLVGRSGGLAQATFADGQADKVARIPRGVDIAGLVCTVDGLTVGQLFLKNCH